MKRPIIASLTVIFIFFFGVVNVFGATINRTEIVGSFTVTVLNDGEPVREIDGVAVVPFDSEYKLLIKNDNDRKAVAKITIDGTNISSFGDLAIPSRSEIKLERFITDSLDQGKRFKFVPLDHPDVDDPGRDENGLIKVELQLEKEREYIQWWGHDGSHWFKKDYFKPMSNNIPCDGGFYDSYAYTTNTSATAEPGATIGGSKSDQQFREVDIDLDDDVWTVEIRLRGVK